MKVQVYAAPLQDEDRAEFSHDFLQLQCEVEFDPEKDYAQVLAEARTHMNLANPNPTQWLPATAMTQSLNHLDAYRELQSTLAKRTTTRPSKIWRNFLFWQKPSKHQVEAEFESIFSTPPHSACKQSRNDTCTSKTRANDNLCMSKCSGPLGLKPITKSNSGPLNHGCRSTLRKNNSGPLYTDGLPSMPYHVRHTKKSYSGPLGLVGSNHFNDHVSSYELLHRPPIFTPLYSC